jgi:hypothetical protein
MTQARLRPTLAAVLAIAGAQAAVAARSAHEVAGEWDPDWGWMVLEVDKDAGGKMLAVSGHWV